MVRFRKCMRRGRTLFLPVCLVPTPPICFANYDCLHFSRFSRCLSHSWFFWAQHPRVFLRGKSKIVIRNISQKEISTLQILYRLVCDFSRKTVIGKNNSYSILDLFLYVNLCILSLLLQVKNAADSLKYKE